jgi:hypothetical protein
MLIFAKAGRETGELGETPEARERINNKLN